MNSASASSLQIQLPDGTLAEHPYDTPAMDVGLGISEGLARSVIAADVSGLVCGRRSPVR